VDRGKQAAQRADKKGGKAPGVFRGGNESARGRRNVGVESNDEKKPYLEEKHANMEKTPQQGASALSNGPMSQATTGKKEENDNRQGQKTSDQRGGKRGQN